MKLALLATYLALPGVALAGSDWGVLPPASGSWAGNANVSVEGGYYENGIQVGDVILIQGPLQMGAPRLVAGAQFVGTGKTICIRVHAVSHEPTTPGVVLPAPSSEVEACAVFRAGLEPPRVSLPQ